MGMCVLLLMAASGDGLVGDVCERVGERCAGLGASWGEAEEWRAYGLLLEMSWWVGELPGEE